MEELAAPNVDDRLNPVETFCTSINVALEEVLVQMFLKNDPRPIETYKPALTKNLQVAQFRT
jgi:hypothetical protein